MTSYVNGVLMAVLRPRLTSDIPEAQVGTQLRADYAEHLPFVYVRETPGGRTSGPNRDSRLGVPFQVDAYGVDDRAAQEAASLVLAALDDAVGSPTDDGYINRVFAVVGPWKFPEPDRLDGVARWVVTGALTVRQPAAL